jgi:hypothetical protein
VKIPTFSRHATNGSTVARPDDVTTTHFSTAADRPAERADGTEPTLDLADPAHRGAAQGHGRAVVRGPDPVLAGRKPRASLLATVGLVLGVVAALLVVSGPLLGYGIALAAVALVVSLLGLFATRRRHVAGKFDALLGLLLSLGAIVVGILALTGSLFWLGTDTQSVNFLREWLDAQFVDRF